METPPCFCGVSENPSVQWKWREGKHRTGRDKAFSPLLGGRIQALSNPEAEMSFRWLSRWMITAASATLASAKSPQHFAPTRCVCTPSRWTETPAIFLRASPGYCKKEYFGNKNFFTRAKSPLAFPNPFLSVKLCFRGTEIYNLTKVTKPGPHFHDSALCSNKTVWFCSHWIKRKCGLYAQQKIANSLTFFLPPQLIHFLGKRSKALRFVFSCNRARLSFLEKPVLPSC